MTVAELIAKLLTIDGGMDVYVSTYVPANAENLTGGRELGVPEYIFMRHGDLIIEVN